MNPTKGDVYCTCSKEDLEELTSKGWELCETHSISKSIPGGSSYEMVENNTGYPVAFTRNHPDLVVHDLVFILKRYRDEVMEGLREEIKHAREEIERLLKMIEEARLAREKESKEFNLSKALLKDVEMVLLNEQKTLVESRQIRQKLEVDIAKLRNEIGAARFREILERDK